MVYLHHGKEKCSPAIVTKKKFVHDFYVRYVKCAQFDEKMFQI